MVSKTTANARNRDTANASRQSGPVSEKEFVARAALERASGKLSDVEWEQARARLLEFASILRGWRRPELATCESELREAA